MAARKQIMTSITRTRIQLAAACLAGLVGGLFVAGGANAQPPAVFVDLGTLPAGTVDNQINTLVPANFTPAQIRWYRFTLAVNANAEANGFFDINTSAGMPPALSNNDSEIGLYSNVGALIATDDDDGAGNYSALSFGLSNPPRPPVGSGLAFNGRDGANVLPAGVYWLAVGAFNTSFAPANWAVTSASAASGNVLTRLSLGQNNAPTSPSGTAAAAPSTVNNTGFDSTLLTVAVTPGQNPVSTGLTVNADLTALGGPGFALLRDDGTNGDVTAGDNVFSLVFTVAPGTATGAQPVSFSISDAQGRGGAAGTIVTVTGPPPANDECVNALSLGGIGGGDVVMGYSNASATDSLASVSCAPIHREIWFAATATASGVYRFSTCGTPTGPGADTVIGVFDSCGGTELACNDDACGLRSITDLVLSAGQSIVVAVGSFNTIGTAQGVLMIQGPLDCIAQAPASPTGGVPGQRMLISVRVGDVCLASVTSVTADLSPIGGPSGFVLFNNATGGDQVDADTVFSRAVMLPPALPPGPYSITHQVTLGTGATFDETGTYGVFGPPACTTTFSDHITTGQSAMGITPRELISQLRRCIGCESNPPGPVAALSAMVDDLELDGLEGGVPRTIECVEAIVRTQTPGTPRAWRFNLFDTLSAALSQQRGNRYSEEFLEPLQTIQNFDPTRHPGFDLVRFQLGTGFNQVGSPANLPHPALYWVSVIAISDTADGNVTIALTDTPLPMGNANAFQTNLIPPPTSIVTTTFNAGYRIRGTGLIQTCPGDFNGDGELNPDDLADYIGCYFAPVPCGPADFNGDGETNPDDLADYIGTFFGGGC